MTLEPLQFKSLSFLFLALLPGPLIIGWFLFRPSPPGAGSSGVLWAALALTVATAVVLVGVLFNRRVTVGDEELTVRSTFYRQAIRFDAIAGLERVSPGSNADPIGWRVNGYGLPGFRSGWFTSRQGGRIFVDTAGGDYLLIRRNGQPDVALGLVDIDEAVRLLERHAPTTRRAP